MLYLCQSYFIYFNPLCHTRSIQNKLAHKLAQDDNLTNSVKKCIKLLALNIFRPNPYRDASRAKIKEIIKRSDINWINNDH